MSSLSFLRAMTASYHRVAGMRRLFAPASIGLLLLSGCGGSDSGADYIKEPARGTTISPQPHATDAGADPGIPGMDMTGRPFGFTDGGSSQLRMQSIDVTLGDGTITMPTTVRAGHLTLRVVNNSATKRTFRLESGNMDAAPVSALEPGGSVTLTADLKPGRYAVHSSGEVDGEEKRTDIELAVTE